MVEGKRSVSTTRSTTSAASKKKRQKLKNAIKQKTKVKQSVKQSTNINIKIGGDMKKKKRKKRKSVAGGGGGRLQRRPHLPTNPLIGAIQYTPPPGYFTPNDFLRALPPPPPPPPAPVAAPPLPVEGPAGMLGAEVGADGRPLAPYHPAAPIPLVAERGRVEIGVPRYMPRNIGPYVHRGAIAEHPALRDAPPLHHPRHLAQEEGPAGSSGGLMGGGGSTSMGNQGSAIDPPRFPGRHRSGPLEAGPARPRARGPTHRAAVAEHHAHAASSPASAARLYQPGGLNVLHTRGRSYGGREGGRHGSGGGANERGGAIPVVAGGGLMGRLKGWHAGRKADKRARDDDVRAARAERELRANLQRGVSFLGDGAALLETTGSDDE